MYYNNKFEIGDIFNWAFSIDYNNFIDQILFTGLKVTTEQTVLSGVFYFLKIWNAHIF